MTGVHPLADLAPRDVVSATMHARMRATGTDHLLLDGTGLGKQTWERRFPTILRLCRERGIDPVREPVPVSPAAHYSCGGVRADLDGRTSVPGLYAVGEVAATGLHGANRLASNSIPEALVTGDLAGRRLVHDLRGGLAVWPGTWAGAGIGGAGVCGRRRASGRSGHPARHGGSHVCRRRRSALPRRARRSARAP
jgi:L-aspartate oxidase